MTDVPGCGLGWRKSSYSGGGNDCVEVASHLARLFAVRDSKNPTGPVVVFSLDAWKEFLDSIR